MSAIFAAVDEVGGIVLVGDGVGCDPRTGVITNLVSKIHVLPEMSLIVGGVGVGGFSPALQHALTGNYSSFDAAREDIVELAKETLAWLVLNRNVVGRAAGTIVFGGWSESAGEHQCWKFSSWLKTRTSGDGAAETLAMEPWHLQRVTGMWLSSAVSDEHMQATGLDWNRQESALDKGARAIAAARLGSDHLNDRGEHWLVGGFIQMAVLTRYSAHSWIAHRWPDQIGERLDVKSGELLPPLPIPF